MDRTGGDRNGSISGELAEYVVKTATEARLKVVLPVLCL